MRMTIVAALAVTTAIVAPAFAQDAKYSASDEINVMQGFKGFFNRGAIIPAMDLV